MEEPEIKYARGRTRKRHETFNGRLKQFKILSDRFRHEIEQHSSCFRACCVLTELSLHYDKGLFSVSDAAYAPRSNRELHEPRVDQNVADQSFF